MDVQAQLARLDTLMSRFPALVEFEKRTKVPKTALAGAAVALLAAVFFFDLGAGKLATISGVAYPAYATLNHLAGDATKEGSQTWLSYWLVFGTFAVLECLGSFLYYWIPLYPLVKTAFLAYLYLPQTQGAKLVYDKVVAGYIIPQLAPAKAPAVTTAPEPPKKTE
ncbi:TB2/DP1, HVA22 family-domain-containing protein [Hyaloraphidium curvatum]|nr:TB2/DP1, HVA22 family-domain-containing protein [Hyaloraphidium curvatum]